MNTTDELQRAVAIAGGQTKLAAATGGKISQQNIWWWINRTQMVPPKHCQTIEEAVQGQVTRYDLRPDIFGTNPAEKNETPGG
jgi:DNA-binding transcriptional regulator YdaS (Cro superfamily)